MCGETLVLHNIEWMGQFHVPRCSSVGKKYGAHCRLLYCATGRLNSSSSSLSLSLLLLLLSFSFPLAQPYSYNETLIHLLFGVRKLQQQNWHLCIDNQQWPWQEANQTGWSQTSVLPSEYFQGKKNYEFPFCSPPHKPRSPLSQEHHVSLCNPSTQSKLHCGEGCRGGVGIW